MHTEFAEWYRTVDLSPQIDQLEKRWQAIESIRKNFNRQQLLQVVRTALPDLIPFSRTDDIIQKFYDADNLFQKHGNDIELQVLTSAIIISALEGTESEETDLIALATVCSRYASKRNATLIPGAYDAAEKYLRNEGKRVRSLNPLTAAAKLPSIDANTKKIQDASAALTASEVTGVAVVNYVTGIVDQVNVVKDTLGAAIEAVVSRQQTLDNNQRILNEEIEISWWLLGEWSKDLEQPFSEVTPAAACIVAAKELADLTYLLPGPTSSKHLLDKSLKFRRDKKVSVPTLQQSVNSLPRDWRARLVETYSPTNLGDLCPVLLAVSKSLETNGDDDWVPAFTKATNLNPSEKIDSLALAYQTYLECLLVRAL